MDRLLTVQSFDIGLDPQLKRLNPREMKYRQSLCTYAANDCDSIYRIIIHSNIINDQYPETTLDNELINGILFNEIKNVHGDEKVTDEADEEIVLGDNGQAMIIGEPFSSINSTEPTTISTIIYHEPPALEQISSDDEEPMDVIPKQKQSNKSIAHYEPEPKPLIYDRPTPTRTVRINSNPSSNNDIEQADPPATQLKHQNPLSEEERRKIHNKSCTRRQRTRAYTREIILYNIEKRFRVKTIKQMLKERGVSITQVNPVKSKRTGQITLYIGIKEPVQVEKYQEIKELFTYKNYRRLFPNKFKRLPPPRAHRYGHGQRNYR